MLEDDLNISVTPYQAIGIPIALFAAVLLALGTHYQSRGVGKAASDGDGFGFRQLPLLLKRPSWLVGTVLLGSAVVLQLVALGFAPLIVVQPLGALALVITALLGARHVKRRLDGVEIRSIGLCVGGIAVFVTAAAIFAHEEPIREPQLFVILGLLLVVYTTAVVLYARAHGSLRAPFYIVAAGVLYGFVVTLAKVVINRVITGNAEWLSVVCVVALGATLALGVFFVQKAYVTGKASLVVAGLTVIDPIVAVGLGIVVLGEAANAPLYAIPIFLLAGAMAGFGVWTLARHGDAEHRSGDES
ncbi:multidrug DMT transporter permease [Labedella populi]|uniref:Multidrug DMT transporter permease n=1 Tax=Labedella populi TaxID=2498850 RepID=A0A3S3ZHI9_9MICO|nr:DMT family transporter [Labedella populi]RWZ59684.1 multidrug DMT transporter permease [Labedella populi]